MIKNCLVCENKFTTDKWYKKFCSRTCAGLFKRGKPTWVKGKKLSETHRQKISKGVLKWIHTKEGEKWLISISGFNNYGWKGGKPKCVDCSKEISFGKKRCVSCWAKSNSGKNSAAYKGSNSYSCIHKFIYKALGKPMQCFHCHKIFTNTRKIHWANKSGKYSRDLNDWIRLCVPCHSKYDVKKF